MIVWPVMPDCGVYLNWPEEGSAWIHPEDLELASKWIPSSRVFRRRSYDGQYYQLFYGEWTIRVKPTMWLRLPGEGFEVGDQVEVLSHFLEKEACVGRVSEIRYDKVQNRILYTIESREMLLSRPFVATDLVPLTRKPHLKPFGS